MKRNKANCRSEITRREFIRAAAPLAAFTIIPRHVLGGPGKTPPSDKLNIACIGVEGKRFDDVRNVMTETVLLGTVAYSVGEKLRWDPVNLKAMNCPKADRFIRRENRKGSEL